MDRGVLDRLVTETLLHNAKAIEKLKSAAEVPDSKNSKKLLTFLMGDVMKRSKGSVNPAHVRAALQQRLAP